MDREALEELMSKRGYTVWATFTKNGGQTIQFVPISAMSVIADRKGPSISILAEIGTGQFELIYNVPYSMNTLRTPLCGSIENEVHFNRILERFKQHASILEESVTTC